MNPPQINSFRLSGVAGVFAVPNVVDRNHCVFEWFLSLLAVLKFGDLPIPASGPVDFCRLFLGVHELASSIGFDYARCGVAAGCCCFPPATSVWVWVAGVLAWLCVLVGGVVRPCLGDPRLSAAVLLPVVFFLPRA